jgi:hypothetical protein
MTAVRIDDEHLAVEVKQRVERRIARLRHGR